MPKINGNLEGVRDSVIDRMLSLYEFSAERDEYLPEPLALLMAEFTAITRREIAVYLSRQGEVLDVQLGKIDHVALQASSLRRNEKRLSQIRCIHTHPNGDSRLSDLDLTAMKRLRLDSICALGVDEEGHVKGVSAAFHRFDSDKKCILQEESPVYPLYKLPKLDWMHRIDQSDDLVFERASGAEGLRERAFLVGIDSEESLSELKALCESAGAEVVGSVLQSKTRPDPGSFIGSGKLFEVSNAVQTLEADLLIVDDELSSIQHGNLEEALPCRVLDRTTLILDIFAQRAKSSEGKLQVSLAQLKYRSSHLVGSRSELSRLGGGIGTRGPGESRLEMDRRLIKKHIDQLQAELRDLKLQNAVKRQKRVNNEIPVVALVGYTNTGKSSLLNRLSGSEVYVMDQLFATLDTVSRKIERPDREGPFILVDTVGFINKLPTDLVEAFRATLEEAALADLLLIVSDASNPRSFEQRQVVEEVLLKLGATHQPRIEVLNKSDIALKEEYPVFPDACSVSAKTGEGLDELLAKIAQGLRSTEREYTFFVPFSQYAALHEIKRMGRVLSETHEEQGTRLKLLMGASSELRLMNRFSAYIVKEDRDQ